MWSCRWCSLSPCKVWATSPTLQSCVSCWLSTLRHSQTSVLTVTLPGSKRSSKAPSHILPLYTSVAYAHHVGNALVDMLSRSCCISGGCDHCTASMCQICLTRTRGSKATAMQAHCCGLRLYVLTQAWRCVAYSLWYWYDPHSVHAVLPYLQAARVCCLEEAQERRVSQHGPPVQALLVRTLPHCCYCCF